ncbi:hypothetical protein Mapa_013691 [Marchantia paleacea]|nr:hypothetical protein Mapa_013691 [Marchantia paleacea]
MSSRFGMRLQLIHGVSSFLSLIATRYLYQGIGTGSFYRYMKRSIFYVYSRSVCGIGDNEVYDDLRRGLRTGLQHRNLRHLIPCQG